MGWLSPFCFWFLRSPVCAFCVLVPFTLSSTVEAHAGPHSSLMELASPDRLRQPALPPLPGSPLSRSHLSAGVGFTCFFFLILPEDMFLLILDRGAGRERKRRKHPCGRETLIRCLSHTPHPETEPTTYVPNRESNMQHFDAHDDSPTSQATGQNVGFTL